MQGSLPELLTVEQAREILKVSTSEVYALCRSGQLPHFRIGGGRGTIRICREELREFLRRCHSPAANRPAAPQPERQAVAMRPFKHLRRNAPPAAPPDGDSPDGDPGARNGR